MIVVTGDDDPSGKLQWLADHVAKLLDFTDAEVHSAAKGGTDVSKFAAVSLAAFRVGSVDWPFQPAGPNSMVPYFMRQKGPNALVVALSEPDLLAEVIQRDMSNALFKQSTLLATRRVASDLLLGRDANLRAIVPAFGRFVTVNRAGEQDVVASANEREKTLLALLRAFVRGPGVRRREFWTGIERSTRLLAEQTLRVRFANIARMGQEASNDAGLANKDGVFDRYATDAVLGSLTWAVEDAKKIVASQVEAPDVEAAALIVGALYPTKSGVFSRDTSQSSFEPSNVVRLSTTQDGAARAAAELLFASETGN